MTASTSPALPPARLAGFLSLITLAAGISAEFFVLDPLIVSGDAMATANNILASEPLYRLGVAAKFVDYTFYLGLTVILYALLKPVSRSSSLLAAAFSFVGTAVMAAAALFYFAPLLLSGGAPAVSVLGTEQLQALAFLSLKLNAVGSNIALAFFGLHLVFVGWLIVKSTFLPRILGVLSAIGGTCFLINSFANFLSPPLAALLPAYIFLPGAFAQAVLALWLFLVGVNGAKWRAQAAAA
jgi:Domain of unknown function (DUF4386)